MKSLLSWLLVGLAATALSISFKSNIWILISMATLLMIPLAFITLKTVRRNYTESKDGDMLLTVVKNSVTDPETLAELRRRELMRTEASRLQAELSRINEISEPLEKLRRMGQWKIKSRVHHSTYANFYQSISDVQKGMESGSKSLSTLNEQDSD